MDHSDKSIALKEALGPRFRALKVAAVIFFIIGLIVAQFFTPVGTFIVGFALASFCALKGYEDAIYREFAVLKCRREGNKVRFSRDNAEITYQLSNENIRWLEPEKSFIFILGMGLCVLDGNDRSPPKEDDANSSSMK